jgi:hypothetical protein
MKSRERDRTTILRSATSDSFLTSGIPARGKMPMSITSRLTKLTTKPATPEHQEEYDKQTGAEADDRTLCLLLACQLENTLERAIDFIIEDQTDDLRRDLYGPDGPLGNFSRKITIAVVTKILGPISQENFRLMRHIRNAFAHAKLPITFDTEEVAAACTALVRFNIILGVE